MDSAPPTDEDGRAAWAEARLADERSGLLARVVALESDMGLLVAASVDSNADDEHDPEGQTIAYERSQLGALTEQVRQHLAEVDAAVARVAAGAYGVCETCGDAINPDRLDARPTARTCIAHAPVVRRGSWRGRALRLDPLAVGCWADAGAGALSVVVYTMITITSVGVGGVYRAGGQRSSAGVGFGGGCHG